MPDLTDEQSEMMEKELKRTEAIIDSMTREERMNHMILNANRRRRIARGSGTTVAAGKLADQAVHRNAPDDAQLSARNVRRRRLARQDDAAHGRHAREWKAAVAIR